jgi:hypothetical protein
MQGLCKGITVLVVGAFIGSWMEGAEWTRLLIVGLIGLGFALCWGFSWIASHWIWPSYDWEIESNYLESFPYDKLDAAWNSNAPQERGKSLTIFFRKTWWNPTARKPRAITRIVFRQGRRHRWDYPLVYGVTLTDADDHIIPEWNGRECKESRLGAGIQIRLQKPLKLGSSTVEIIDPKPEGPSSPKASSCWAFEQLIVTECLFPWMTRWGWINKYLGIMIEHDL